MKDYGRLLVALGFIFIGLKTMSGAFKPLRTDETFLYYLQYFTADSYLSLLGCIVMGCILTMIVQSSSINQEATDITFTIPETDLIIAESTIKKIQKKIGLKKFITDTNVVKISVVGNAMRTQSGIAKTMFETLANNQINIHVISTSEIKISVLISSDYYELAMRSLHSAFGLDV